MKKIGFVVPFMAVSLLISCGGSKPTNYITHKFTFNGEHCRVNGLLKYTHDIYENDENVQYTIIADQEWKLPGTIDSEDIKYNKDTGVITIDKITHDITLNVTAKSNPTPGATFAVSFDANGGEVTSTNPITVVTHKTIMETDKPTLADRLGYDKEQVIWKDKDNNEFIFGPEGTGTPVTENMVLKADWGEIEKFAVTFYEGKGGTNPQTQPVSYGGKPVYYTPKGEEGDTFLGWFEGPEDGAKEFSFDEQIYSDNVKAYAHWQSPTPKEKFTVKWVNYDGTLLQENKDVIEGIVAPEYKQETPIRESDAHYEYAFAGWLPAERSKVYSNQIYTAQYKVVQTYDNNLYLEVNIPENDKTFSINSDSYSAIGNVSIDWGDNKELDVIDDPEKPLQHTYDLPGKYKIRMYGAIYDLNCSDNKKINNIYLGGSFTSIKRDAFSECSSLTSITIPNSVTTIGTRAFYNCTSLTSITIPNSVTTIEPNAFYNCTSLTSIIIPNSVTAIGTGAFYNCIGLTSINIPSSVTFLQYETIGHPFIGCINLETITVDPENTTYTSRNGGEECNAIITKSDNILIAGCKNTKIPSGIATISAFAFTGCNGLTSVTIPDSVTKICDAAFSYCESLSIVDLTQFKENNIPALFYIYFTPFDDDNPSLKFYVSSGMSGKFKEADGWKDYNPNHFTEDPVPSI